MNSYVFVNPLCCASDPVTTPGRMSINIALEDDDLEGDLVPIGAVMFRDWPDKPNRDHDLASLPYKEYLDTPHWRAVRRRALLRAGHQCKRCESTGPRLDVHHLTYDRLGREAESDVIVLCRTCHGFEHQQTGRRRHGR